MTLQQSLLRAALEILLDRFDPEALIAAIEAHRIDTVYLVP